MCVHARWTAASLAIQNKKKSSAYSLIWIRSPCPGTTGGWLHSNKRLIRATSMNGFTSGAWVQRRENGVPPFVHLATDRPLREERERKRVSRSPHPLEEGFICRASESGTHTNNSRANAFGEVYLSTPCLFLSTATWYSYFNWWSLNFLPPIGDFMSKLYYLNIEE